MNDGPSLDEIIKKAIAERPQATEGHLAAMDFSAYIDSALQADERDRMERHLASCPDCLDELIALKHLTRAVALNPMRPPDELVQKVIALGARPWWMERWQRLRKQLSYEGSPFSPLFAVGAVAAIAFILLFSWQSLKQKEMSEIAMQPPSQPKGFGFTERGPILYSQTILLTDDLQKALLTHYDDKNQQQLKQVTDLLLKQDAALPAGNIVDIVILNDALKAMQVGNRSHGQFALRLYKNGELEISSLIP
jgi:hypothetical protein